MTLVALPLATIMETEVYLPDIPTSPPRSHSERLNRHLRGREVSEIENERLFNYHRALFFKIPNTIARTKTPEMVDKAIQTDAILINKGRK